MKCQEVGFALRSYIDSALHYLPTHNGPSKQPVIGDAAIVQRVTSMEQAMPDMFESTQGAAGALLAASMILKQRVSSAAEKGGLVSFDADGQLDMGSINGVTEACIASASIAGDISEQLEAVCNQARQGWVRAALATEKELRKQLQEKSVAEATAMERIKVLEADLAKARRKEEALEGEKRVLGERVQAEQTRAAMAEGRASNLTSLINELKDRADTLYQ